MSKLTTDIVGKLWNLCNVLRDDGVTYHQYVSELTYLLFLKMAKETGAELSNKTRGYAGLPEGYRWDDLEAKAAPERLTFYKHLLIHLGEHGKGIVQQIFVNASSFIKKPATLTQLVNAIDAIDWYSAKEEGLGDLYEGLLEKNAGEKKSGAGQYFTPRVLIDSMVALMQPQLGETIQDPAAGTGGFLIAANHFIRQHNNIDALDKKTYDRFRRQFHGMELVQDTQRLGLMNLMLHNLQSDDSSGLHFGDTLSSDHQKLPKADLILTNPPFGTKKGGGLPTRDDFTYPTSNKQLAFLQHIVRGLKPGGRAAVLLPDNVLFESGVGVQIRRDLMDKCNLHTLLRLPTGIFYAQGVKTNVLFFSRGVKDTGNTKHVWVHDLRANMPAFGKRTPLTRAHFAEFEKAFGKKADGSSKRTDTGVEGRFRVFSREEIAARGDSLDISWLKDDSEHANGDLPEPEVLVGEAINELEGAVAELRSILAELGLEEEA